MCKVATGYSFYVVGKYFMFMEKVPESNFWLVWNILIIVVAMAILAPIWQRPAADNS